MKCKSFEDERDAPLLTGLSQLGGITRLEDIDDRAEISKEVGQGRLLPVSASVVESVKVLVLIVLVFAALILVAAATATFASATAPSIDRGGLESAKQDECGRNSHRVFEWSVSIALLFGVVRAGEELGVVPYSVVRQSWDLEKPKSHCQLLW